MAHIVIMLQREERRNGSADSTCMHARGGLPGHRLEVAPYPWFPWSQVKAIQAELEAGQCTHLAELLQVVQVSGPAE